MTIHNKTYAKHKYTFFYSSHAVHPDRRVTGTSSPLRSLCTLSTLEMSLHVRAPTRLPSRPNPRSSDTT